MLKLCVFNAALVTALVIGFSPGQAAPLTPAPSEKVGSDSETAEQKAFHAKADAALKALDEKTERRNQAARRAMMGICTGCLGRSGATTATARRTQETDEVDPFAGTVDAAAADEPTQPAAPSARPQTARGVAAAPIAPPLQILPDRAR
ncbi:hypothetical protein [Chelatococcus asaccharovorans]|uniref:hypothetical protein n=1 Tax=Chelatococcus asaccharovorans TaxID=28210 RepID=UPI00224C633F|nr:hypothetical protein [Chelatococcus asaccharovorans]CAH1672838.1 Peptidyl-prolyl cis-trans isomerase ppiD [Chelatococcus asaccharovorans]CAH1675745.1 Peptidyl-prolyl cis-trans isomerase ppiD [Chelatococcus asaccharovorans]